MESPQNKLHELITGTVQFHIPDLIRNFILMRLSSDKDEQCHIYKQYWLPIENQLGKNLTEFFRHYLIMTKKQFIREIDVYDAMRDHILRSDTPIREHIMNLFQFAEYYAQIIGIKSAINPDVQREMHRLNRLGYTVTYPFIMEMYHSHAIGHISNDELYRSLTTLENFLIRRIVCGIPSNRLNKIFPKLYNEIRETQHALLPKDFPFALAYTLYTKDYPNDKAFGDALLTCKLYKTAGKNEVCRLILETLETGYAHKEMPDLHNFNISIEHIMPQTLTNEWKHEIGENYLAVHDIYLHTIGNLTLTGYNAELSNSSFLDKQKLLSESHLQLNKYFCNITRWTETEIIERAKILTEKAINTWRYFALDSEPANHPD